MANCERQYKIGFETLTYANVATLQAAEELLEPDMLNELHKNAVQVECHSFAALQISVNDV